MSKPSKSNKSRSMKSLRTVVAPKLIHQAFHPSRQVTSAEVALRAYHIWQSEACPHGRHVEHWLAAEAALRAGR